LEIRLVVSLTAPLAFSPMGFSFWYVGCFFLNGLDESPEKKCQPMFVFHAALALLKKQNAALAS
jgi:hypothetical protein